MDHHSNHNLSHNRNKKGSILIWSVMLGFILTSVFFFFAMRQRATIVAQRDTMAILNTKAYLESFAEYIEKLDPKDPNEKTALEDFKKNGVNYDGITGTVTNNPTEITGVIDLDQEKKYEFSGNIYIEWNKCAANMKANLYLNNTLYKATGDCNNKTYADIAGPVKIEEKSFTLKAPNAPFYYRITGDNDTKLIDGKWYMDLSIDLVNGKKYTVKKGF